MSRDVSFFDSLGRLLVLEREAERARMEALAEGLSLQQRAEQGLSFLDLESIEEEVGLGGRVLVTLARKDRARFPARLDNGDQVAVFPRRAEVKEPARALVSRATATRVTLAFDREPPPFVHGLSGVSNQDDRLNGDCPNNHPKHRLTVRRRQRYQP